MVSDDEKEDWRDRAKEVRESCGTVWIELRLDGKDPPALHSEITGGRVPESEVCGDHPIPINNFNHCTLKKGHTGVHVAGCLMSGRRIPFHYVWWREEDFFEEIGL